MAVGSAREVEAPSPQADAAVPGGAAVLEQLERIFASPDFDASPRSRAFVRFILEETLAGRQEALTQVAIATRVFGRRDDFDPTVDPIVRIQAGRLRRSLERYYLLAGVADPVRIELPRGTYVPVARWAGASEEGPGADPAPLPARDPDGWPAVAVRAFAIEGEVGPGFDAVARRFHDDLCLELGRYGDVRVVRREPGPRKCDLDFELSGCLSGRDGGIRVTAQLLDCRGASQVWAEEYRSAANAADASGDLFARLIAARVASEQGAVARRLLAAPSPDRAGPESAYSAVLRSYRFFRNREPADFTPAVAALRRVVAKQPECALAWVQLSRLLTANYAFEVAPASSIEEAIDCALRAVQLDSASQRARVALAGAFLVKGELAASRAEAERALALSQGSLVYVEWIGWLLALLGEWERGTALIRESIARNPNHVPVAAHALWADHLRRGEPEQAYQVALQLPDVTFFWRSLMRACCLGRLGRLEEARLEAAELLRRKPDFASRGRVLIGRYIKLPELFERVVDGLGRAGLALD